MKSAKMLSTIGALIAAFALLAILSACGGGGGGYGGGSMSSSNYGTLKLALTDAPACGYDHVYVTIQKIGVNQSTTAGDSDPGWYDIVLNPASRIDLLTLTNGVMTTLGQTALPPGKYTQLRLVLAANGSSTPPANSVVLSGTTTETALTTPSAQQSGLKMNIDIDVAANQLADAVVDFNACKSIVAAGNSGNYILKPVLSVTPLFLSGATGSVSGNVAGTTVSLQQAGVAVKSTAPDSTGKFLLEPVAPGTYDLVVTAPGYATEVVTGVVVASNVITTVSSSPLTLSSSTSGTANGTVTTTATPIDATVRALQTLAGGDTIEVASEPANATTGAYSFSLPLTGPMVAAYSASGTLTFAADATAAAKYNIEASSGGVVKTAGPLIITASTATVTNFSFP